MADRTTVPELRSFVSALIQSAELGIPIAHVLREQAKEMRVRRRQRAEEQAQKVPVKITFPLILCLFPALLVVDHRAGDHPDRALAVPRIGRRRRGQPRPAVAGSTSAG